MERAAKAAAAAQQGRRIAGRRPADPDTALARAEADVQAIATKIDNACSQRAARQAAREEQAAAQGRRPKGPKATDQPTRRERRQLEHAEQSLAAARAATQTATPHDRQANITDPDSRIMKTPTGWVQGYNAQAVANDRHIVLACDVTQDARDVHQYAPMIATVIDMLTAAGITDPIGIVLADAGYWSDNNATTNGPDRLIATLKDWKQRQAVRDLGQTSGPPPQQASPLEAMEHRLRTPHGAHLYAQRSCTIEPVFGNHKENRGHPRFRRRGLAAARQRMVTDQHQPQPHKTLRPACQHDSHTHLTPPRRDRQPVSTHPLPAAHNPPSKKPEIDAARPTTAHPTPQFATACLLPNRATRTIIAGDRPATQRRC